MAGFVKNDSPFTCAVCGKRVEALGYSSRNHCNGCLCSLHLDVSPGDRANACGGVMRPVSAVKNRKGFVVIFRCEKCGAIGKNKAAEDDDKELIIELTATPFKE